MRVVFGSGNNGLAAANKAVNRMANNRRVATNLQAAAGVILLTIDFDYILGFSQLDYPLS